MCDFFAAYKIDCCGCIFFYSRFSFFLNAHLSCCFSLFFSWILFILQIAGRGKTRIRLIYETADFTTNTYTWVVFCLFVCFTRNYSFTVACVICFCVDSCSLHNYVIILFKDEFSLFFLFSFEITRFAQKHRKRRCFVPYLLSWFFVVLFLCVSFFNV